MNEEHLVTAAGLSADGLLAADTAHLRFLARQIRDEAHLTAILDTVDDIVMRAAIRRLIVPMLSFRVDDAASAH